MPSPKTFTKIADHFRERILSGELEPGAKLPTNREIAGQLEIVRGSLIRSALSRLDQ